MALGTAVSVTGGKLNAADDPYSTVSGGNCNLASKTAAFPPPSFCPGGETGFASVTGGYKNRASGNYSTVTGGDQNTASGGSSVVSGGLSVTQGFALGWSGGSSGPAFSGKFSSP